MDLSNVVFIDENPSGNKAKANTAGKKPKANNKKKTKKSDSKKTSKKVPLKGGKTKRAKPQKPQRQAKALSKNWFKTPPKDQEPHTKRRRGRTYHWCPHCRFWSLHAPGTSKVCQAVDPLAHLLNYFGTKATNEPSLLQDDASMADVSMLFSACSL